ncbi:bifunctional 2-C-methyl-D-erythritol 4-phosphate cytidylyltransferase/2-C-methyl-D-erythritol 2,4-cyclodiphosphate synthase [Roseibium sp. Sym1]|uniref:bifunctional 2-C-methyl-D-erythritol 4-phosphate cytidylyltransferase/2-C-methyl-D-erythritol 2,4-cyclodiphosphate synthase n=1 Tax=Roseibium sp. Sym1 TaxID=3016006 RepID=UPI0022B422F7|nr:bifunctional 2-C-methyl-D-erythritol 4-phosphate cytidylyltransferase/2-C-methyl-D-erythritol 2,4-cyclodiphosphate synthase [Roseibium sp. Sym1]
MTKPAAALVVAAGRGTRLADPDDALPKQYRRLAGRSVLTHTLNALGNHPRINRVAVVIHRDDRNLYDEAVASLDETSAAKLVSPVTGGQTRQQSVHAGLRALEATGCDHVLIHDAARPFVSSAVLDRLFQALDAGADGVLAAVPVVDTLKKADADGRSIETVDRTGLWAAQTPQAFALGRILAAHENAAGEGRHDFTDDTGLAEWSGMSIVLSEGDPANFKITTAADLSRAQTEAESRTMAKPDETRRPLAELTDMRTGIGYDVHAFDDGDHVVLGGVPIPHSRSLKGHSDADVVLHAITDATLGAIGDGDIGQHFPPSDPLWKGASSDKFQLDALRRVAALGGRLAHVDVTIVCEEPKIGPHRQSLRESIGRICDLPVSRVSVKATTSEKLGFTGRKEGIAALASVTVRLPFGKEE